MAILITGLQGSGKSYKAMYDMYHDQDKYYKIFTNLDGLKQTRKILPLNFKKFTDEVLTECYNLIVTQSKEYDDVIVYLQRIHMLPYDVSKDSRILLVIDEAQNYFNKKNPILAWFITQHRHLFIELVLITQKHTLLHSDYHLFNLAYNAFPPVKQFSKNSISYNEYAGLPMNDDNFVRKFSLRKEDKVFSMYVSGDKVESPNILKRFIWMFLFAIGILLAGIYYFTNMYGHSSTSEVAKVKKETSSHNTNPTNIVQNNTYDENEKFYTFVVFKDRFYIQGVGGDDNPLKLLIYLQKHYFKTVIDKQKRDKYHMVIYAICDVAIERLFKRKKEKSTLGAGMDTMASFN